MGLRDPRSVAWILCIFILAVDLVMLLLNANFVEKSTSRKIEVIARRSGGGGASAFGEDSSQDTHSATPKGSRDKPTLNLNNWLTEEQEWETVARELPNAPIDLMRRHSRMEEAEKMLQDESEKKSEALDLCRRLPHYWDLRMSGRQWQVVQNGEENVLFVFSAYHDTRAYTNLIRLIVVSDKYETSVSNLRCLVWFRGYPSPVVRHMYEATFASMDFPRYYNETFHPHLLSCFLLETDPARPEAVSVLGREEVEACDRVPTNCIKVNNKEDGTSKGSPPVELAACVRPMIFSNPGLVPRLVEWLEMQRLLGVGTVRFFYFYLADDIHRLMEHYRDDGGLVQFTRASLPGDMHPDHYLQVQYLDNGDDGETIRRLSDLAFHNDCLYRNVNQGVKYTAVLDVDEVIIPRSDITLLEHIRSMDSLANSTFTTFTFKHVYFMDNMTADGDMQSDLLRDVPAFLHLLRHPVRGENFIPKAQPKSVHRTNRVKTVRAHYASNCLQSPQEKCVELWEDENVALMAHYRQGCAEGIRNCPNYTSPTVNDPIIFRYKESLMSRTLAALGKLGFLESSHK